MLGRHHDGSPLYAIADGNGVAEGGSGSGSSGQAGSEAQSQSGQSGDGTAGEGSGQEGQQSGQRSGQSGSGSGDGDSTDWKALARQWEKRAKDNKGAADELATLKASQMSDQEKAVAEAETRGRTAAALEHGKELAASRFEAAAAKAGVNLGDATDLIDTARFVDKDGKVDNDAITAAVKKLAKLAPKGAGRSGGDMGGGSGSGDQGASLDKQIEEATRKRNFPEVVRLKRLKAAQT
ncbi:hypothetical protein F9278_15915 [Streptomyces phaeolivaceus]|uniref:Uncharacterized protein n=1 Tax=Streptomyces phaeolivaceus TaxID=2653200 RepID=A0A5P8K2G2_9ACTN|nr:hypothetical protein [Streptomyces phaeolivaceus]QFQ97453.1 hypothetical protein F9278_15915 [Streptomyces phaeolivaceus]